MLHYAVMLLAAALAVPPSGSINPAVKPANVRETVCVAGWTKTVRPRSSYINRLKAAYMIAYGLPGSASDCRSAATRPTLRTSRCNHGPKLGGRTLSGGRRTVNYAAAGSPCGRRNRWSASGEVPRRRRRPESRAE